MELQLPALLSVAKTATSAWSLTTDTLKSGFAFAKSAILDGSFSLANGLVSDPRREDEPSHGDMVAPDQPTTEIEETSHRLWGDFPCCVGCVSRLF